MQCMLKVKLYTLCLHSFMLLHSLYLFLFLECGHDFAFYFPLQGWTFKLCSKVSFMQGRKARLKSNWSVGSMQQKRARASSLPPTFNTSEAIANGTTSRIPLRSPASTEDLQRSYMDVLDATSEESPENDKVILSLSLSWSLHVIGLGERKHLL